MTIAPAKKGLTVLTDPNPQLRKVSEDVSVEELQTDEMKKFLSELYKTMLDDDGIGIAAPQVGVAKRICFISDVGKNPRVLINPEIAWSSKTMISMQEGCLSVPNVFGPVTRPKAVHIKALDENGKKLKIKAKGWLSRVTQHEIDHLDGILFVDKADYLEKNNDEKQSLL
ncbi:MAG: peptide deformylase [Parcubacteria group bacterium]|nr:peptide deformylase [Parcubacteria group bacterium]